MKPNRVSYGSKYAVQIRVPKKPPKQVTCEFAWQAEQVAEREKRNVDNMVHGTVIIRSRHAQPMQRWEFDAEDVRWHSVYTRNASKKYVLIEYGFERSSGKYVRESEERVSLADFFDANAHDDEVMDEEKKIRTLPVGGEVKFGGGAAPLTAIRRIS